MIKIRCCTVLWIQSVSARSVDTDQLTNTRNGVAQARPGNKPRPALYPWISLATSQRAGEQHGFDWWIYASFTCTSFFFKRSPRLIGEFKALRQIAYKSCSSKFSVDRSLNPKCLYKTTLHSKSYFTTLKRGTLPFKVSKFRYVVEI